MKILLLLLLVLISAFSPNQPQIEYVDILRISDLYETGQYEAVKAMLANEGYEMGKSMPDYSLYGTTHKGEFAMERETESPSLAYRELGFKHRNSWWFETEVREDGQAVTINFDLGRKDAPELFERLTTLWRESGFEEYDAKPRCSPNEKCAEFGGEMLNAPKGYKKYCQIALGLHETDVREQNGSLTHISYVKGRFRFNQTKVIPVATAKKPPVRHK